MRREGSQKDLVVLVADNNMEHTVRGLLCRHDSLGIRSFHFDIFRHPEHDPGCRLRSPQFLQPLVNRYAHGLVMFDRQGCGKEELSREVLEAEVETRLSRAGWGERAAAIVLDPELEIWVWSDSPHVDSILGWSNRSPDLRTWLKAEGLFETSVDKPKRPKEAMESAQKFAKKARSSALYFQLAQKVSLTRCVDPAFSKFKTTLQGWFSPNT